MQRLFFLVLAGLLLLNVPVKADDARRPDDRVIFDLSGEDWVMTKTARVTVNVEAAVSDKNVGTMRSDMVKAVNDIAKGDWRLISFNRSQDQTGLERWSALFESRLPENLLNGLNDAAKKLSKAGMQLSISNVDFTPTLEEMETARGSLRTQIYKSANEQLTALNNAMPGRNYRIAMINFTGSGDEQGVVPMPKVVRGQMNMMMAAAPTASESTATPPMERAEKITLNAHIVLAAMPENKSVPTPAPAK